MEKNSARPAGTILRILAVVFLLFGIRWAFVIADYGLSAWLIVLALILWLGGSYGLTRLSPRLLSIPEPKKLWKSVLILSLAVLLPRLCMIFFSGMPLFSDFEEYVRQAERLADGGCVDDVPFLANIAPNTLAYLWVLSRVMRLFGKGQLTAQLFCLALYWGSVLSLYAIARELVSSRKAFLAALLMALLPETILYSIYPGIEYIALLPMLLGLWLMLRSPYGKRWHGTVLMLGAGLCFGFSYINRANALAVLAAGFVWLLRKKEKLPLWQVLVTLLMLVLMLLLKDWFLLLLLLPALVWYFSRSRRDFLWKLLAFVGGFLVFRFWQNGLQLSMLGGVKVTQPFGWMLYEGMDRQGNGGWTPEKLQFQKELLKQYSGPELQLQFLKAAWERLSAYSLWEWLDLFLRKGGAVWFDSSYCLDFFSGTAPVLQVIYVVADVVWLFFMGTLTVKLWKQSGKAFAEDRRGCLPICLLPIGLTLLWHLFATSIARYHYMAIPFLLLLWVCLLPENPSEKLDCEKLNKK